jgi:ABC-type sugar transport system permease subunit
VKVSKWTLLWLVIVLALAIVWGSMLAGLIRLTDIVLNFFLIIFSLVVIAILAIIGAVFVGIFVSHRIISAQGFTPFEREMLEMREDVKQIKEKLEAIEGRIGQTKAKGRE